MPKAATTKRKRPVAPDDTTGGDIIVHRARVHNLRDVTVHFPRRTLIVVTGVSGSGKSSLTIDTLYAEGQRRYAESLSAYARQFLTRMDKPDVDYIQGLCPAIAIQQKVITRTPRSTVGSMTEAYDYLRLLYARIGRTISPVSGREVRKHDVSAVVDAICQLPEGAKVLLLAPFRTGRGRDPQEELGILLQKGFSRLYDSRSKALSRLEELQTMPRWKPTTDTWVLVDRLVTRPFEEDDRHRMADSVATAFYEGEGDCSLEVDGKRLLPFSNRFELDGMRFEEPVPNLFSFNNPFGACPRCEGFSQVLGIDPNLVIPDDRLSVYEGAVAPWKGEKLGEWKEQFIRGAKQAGFPIHRPVAALTPAQREVLWKGDRHVAGINDFFREVEQNLYKVQYRVLLSRYRGRTTCPDCRGQRLRPEALYVKVGGRGIGELCDMPVAELSAWFEGLSLTPYEEQVARRVLLEIRQRLRTLLEVGLGYLTLNRLANSLSGGESQRIQLTRSLGSNLTNSLYILDEPSIGLHPRDTHRLIGVLKELRDLDNTVVVVEHDEQMMREADYIIDMGPLASHQGGQVVAAGGYAAILDHPTSLTARYLRGDLRIEAPVMPRSWKQSILVEGARQHNLRDLDVRIPLGLLCVVCGVSGSGKTTLIRQVLQPALQKLKTGVAESVGLHRRLSGDLEAFSQVEMVDQNPIGKSSRSNPVTYVKAWDEVRDLFSRQPLSRMRGYQPRHFSFNVDGGRCDTCKGEGEQVVEMQFLADVHLTCESCRGRRFREDVLEVTYEGRNIYDVLSMSVDEAIAFFKGEPDIARKLQPLQDVGLGYISLGQSSDTLSGGEAQRVKLASFLTRGRAQERLFFIFDEPTTGLHFHDIGKLLASMQALIAQGHSVLVVEHNLDVIRCADWVIELGPEAGKGGGNIVYEGVPAGLKGYKGSPTGAYL
ncbi:MAG: excinuclease ABC subunit A [Bacteroidetes bacterium]|nr:excinuclease ABC subunit A [Bacteroidota bacterium]